MEWNSSANDFVEALASSNPTPGGGAAAAMAGAMGCALALMAANTTLRQKLASQQQGLLTESIKQLQTLKEALKTLIQKDAKAYDSYIAARKLPKENPNRQNILQDALWFAATVPVDTATTAVHCLHEIDKIKDSIAPVIVSDVLCAQHLLQSAIRCAVENIRANIAYITNEERKEMLEKQIITLLKSC